MGERAEYGDRLAAAGSLLSAAVALALLVWGLIALLTGDGSGPVQVLLAVVLLLAAVLLARKAFDVRVPLPAAEAPRHAVMFFNPKSGGGKAGRFALADEARARMIEPVELAAGSDLEKLVRDAVARGADGLAMAGGDGSQSIVAAIAAESGLPYACIPAGTRNHFALDLGVDRDDVVGALDAFVDAGERRVDLGEVNGRVFVNNVSLGIYGEAVKRDEYRDAKIKTLLETVPEIIGADGEAPVLRWTDPRGRQRSSAAAILVSNNRYRLGTSIGSGTRPKIDGGRLGVTVLADPAAEGRRPRPFEKLWGDWSASRFEVGADGPVAAGIDGEACDLDPPLRFGIQAGVLRVRIAREHPGASPSAVIPKGAGRVAGALLRIATGRPRRIAR